MEFSQWLQTEMDAKHITKYRLAKLSGVHQTTISNLLAGKHPQIETEKKIRTALSEIERLEINRAPDGQKEKPAPEGELDEETIELRDFWDSSDADERQALLEMARLIKKQRRK